MVLGLRAYRQQLLASNIADADTPGYKAVDIDFREAVRIAQATGSGPVPLSMTDARHLSAMAPDVRTRIPVEYWIPHPAAADGDAVDMDEERAQFAQNTVMYQFSLDRVSGELKHMMEMLQSLKD